jgi:uncharacterized protein YjiK
MRRRLYNGGFRVVGAIGLFTVLSCQGRDLALDAESRTARVSRYHLGAAPTWQVVLPQALHEISGLAVTGDGRLFAHGDEDGTVFEVEPRAGRIVKRFALAATGREPDLGKKPEAGRVTGDFEDITVVGDRFYMVTSNGVLVEFAEGADGARVPFTVHQTGLDGRCEVEGLTHDPAHRTLLLLCKELRSRANRDRVEIYAWSIANRRIDPKPAVTVSYLALASLTGVRAFNGSAITYMPGGDTLLLIAGPQRAYAEITGRGQIVRGGPLDRASQTQPEGVAFLGDGTLLISSEGGKGQATLSGYMLR